MVAQEERDLLLQALVGYLEELRESGVEELPFGEAAEPAAQAAQAAPAAQAAQAATSAQAAQAAQAATSAQVRAAGSAGDAQEAGSATCTGAGNPRARLLFVMRGSGFGGEAGGLLAKIVQAMGFATSDVYLLTFAAASPSREELLKCVRDVAPEVVVALGEESAQLLLESREPVQKLRGRFHELEGVQLMPTLHPEMLVADQTLKREVWNEMQQVMRLLASQPAR